MRNQPEFLLSFYGTLVRGGWPCRSTPTRVARCSTP